MKKFLCLTTFVLLCYSYFVNEDFVNYSNLNNFSLISISLTSIDSRDSNNLSDESLQQVLSTLFVESIFRDYVKTELPSFIPITNILSKNFSSLWIINEVLNFVVKKIDYIVQETKKVFIYFVKILSIVTLSFSFLFYIKTHLKTYRFAPIVLRC